LRVRDGETNILAGLIQRDERHSNTGIPGLNEVPIVSRLFGAGEDSDTRTEIVLLITPRIVRNLDVPGIGQQEFLSGTDAAVGAPPIQLGTSSGPATGAQPARPVAPVRQQQTPPPAQVPQPSQQTPQPAPSPFYPPVAPAAPASALTGTAPPAFSPPPLIPTPPGTQ
jgi:general secretion pathway protein D